MARTKKRNQVEESSEEESSDNVEESDVSESDNDSGDNDSGDNDSGDNDSEDENQSDEDTESEEEPPKRVAKKPRKVAAATKTGIKRKQKKKKDPNAPKKPMSAYMLYSNHMRPQVMGDNPDMKFGEVTKHIAANFRELDASTRKKWDKKAMKERQRFQREMANYSPPDESSDESNNGGKKKKRKKDPNAPKKALSSYMYFMNRNRARIKEANPDATFGETARLVAAEFRSLTPEGKQKYEALAAKDKKRYQKEMADYVPPKGAKGKKFKDPNKPKRAMTSFMCFSNATRAKVRQEYPDLGFGDVGKKIGQMFRGLTPKEKSKYEKIANKDKERYRREMDAYNKKQAGGDVSEEEEEEQSEDGSDSGSASGSGDASEQSDDGSGSGSGNDSASEEEQDDDTEEESE